jgi:hypothetical protein
MQSIGSDKVIAQPTSDHVFNHWLKGKKNIELQTQTPHTMLTLGHE